jgi:hypothetical protein
MEILGSGITAPDWSVTVPESDPPTTCALAVADRQRLSINAVSAARPALACFAVPTMVYLLIRLLTTAQSCLDYRRRFWNKSSMSSLEFSFSLIHKVDCQLRLLALGDAAYGA